jgi:hypothetical protein
MPRTKLKIKQIPAKARIKRVIKKMPNTNVTIQLTLKFAHNDVKK